MYTRIEISDDGSRDDPEDYITGDRVKKISWIDTLGDKRSIVIGSYLYEYEFNFHDGRSQVERKVNNDAVGHQGFGYVVSHRRRPPYNSPLGKGMPLIKTETLNGEYHAFHRITLIYDRDKQGDGLGMKIPVVIEWFLATGRNHPLWSVTWKMSEFENPRGIEIDEVDVSMDSRSPYGSLSFDGASSNDVISGIAWGDYQYKFITNTDFDSKLTINSTWTYNQPNKVNFTQAWTLNKNAEIGIVQTKYDPEMGMPDMVYGSQRGKTSSDFDNTLPDLNMWPYQLMNYGLDDSETKNKLIAWGTPYGWLGSSKFNAMDGEEHNGKGDRCYSTFIVLGPHYRFKSGADERDLEQGEVNRVVTEVEALMSVTISAVPIGSLATDIEKGPGSTEKKTIQNGYNDTYAAFTFFADDNKVAFWFSTGVGKPVTNPVFIIKNYDPTKTPDPIIHVNDKDFLINPSMVVDGSAFLSVNTIKNELWITLITTINGKSLIAINSEGLVDFSGLVIQRDVNPPIEPEPDPINFLENFPGL